MNEEKSQVVPESVETIVPAKKPDELPRLNVEARFKIFDPVTGEVKVEGRA